MPVKDALEMNEPVKPLLRYITNALSLLALSGMISTGLILKFILPAGSGRMHGRGFGGGKPAMTWLGQSRHEWGDWHFYISIVFLALMALHIILNWNWIRVTAWGTRQHPQPWLRKALSILIVLFILFVGFVPFVIKVREIV
jgi:hypothetical protein